MHVLATAWWANNTGPCLGAEQMHLVKNACRHSVPKCLVWEVLASHLIAKVRPHGRVATGPALLLVPRRRRGYLRGLPRHERPLSVALRMPPEVLRWAQLRSSKTPSEPDSNSSQALLPFEVHRAPRPDDRPPENPRTHHVQGRLAWNVVQVDVSAAAQGVCQGSDERARTVVPSGRPALRVPYSSEFCCRLPSGDADAGDCCRLAGTSAGEDKVEEGGNLAAAKGSGPAGLVLAEGG